MKNILKNLHLKSASQRRQTNECVSFKNFKLNKIRHILDTSSKESQTNDTIREEYYHLLDDNTLPEFKPLG